MSATAADNLEDLDNKALRAKCVEYGLPNVPITDTSRKLLIKKLRVAMEGGGKSTENPKSRRETVHTIKIDVEPRDDVEKKKETTRAKTSRRTIDAVSTPVQEAETTKSNITMKALSRRTIDAGTTAVKETETLKSTNTTQRRKSERKTPTKKESEAVRAAKRSAAVIEEEDTEEEEHVVKTYNIPQTTRQSRSPSLSKSTTVTTSYCFETAPDPIKEIADYEDEEDILEEEPELNLSPVREKIIKPTYSSVSKSYDITKPFAPTIYKEPISNYIGSSNRLGETTSIRNISPNPTSIYASSLSRRYTSGDYTGPEISKTPLRETTRYVEEQEEEEEKSESLETPYLSDFARRLSRLKAEPLVKRMTPEVSEPSQPKEIRRYYPSTINARRGISQKESLGESFSKLVYALDRQYNLKRNLIIASIFLLIVLIYFIFF